MSRLTTFIRMNPFDSKTFGVHIGTRPYENKELDPYLLYNSCFNGNIRLHPIKDSLHALICDKCGIALKPRTTDLLAIMNMWALMTCQVSISEKTSGSTRFIDEMGLHKFMPNNDNIAILSMMGNPLRCLVWKDWMGSRDDLAVVIPPDWPATPETISKIGVAGIHLVRGLTAIHGEAVKDAASKLQSTFGWLYNQ